MYTAVIALMSVFAGTAEASSVILGDSVRTYVCLQDFYLRWIRNGLANSDEIWQAGPF